MDLTRMTSKGVLYMLQFGIALNRTCLSYWFFLSAICSSICSEWQSIFFYALSTALNRSCGNSKSTSSLNRHVLISIPIQGRHTKIWRNVGARQLQSRGTRADSALDGLLKVQLYERLESTLGTTRSLFLSRERETTANRISRQHKCLKIAKTSKKAYFFLEAS